MDLNSNMNIMMDFVRLETDVRQKAKEYLDDITEENLRSFAEATKYVAQSVLENYFISVDNLYTNGTMKINDEKVFNKFIDFHDGYRAKMRKWASEKKISIVERKIDPTIHYPELSNESIIKTPLAIAGVGTLVVVGLIIFAEVAIWVTVAAELLVLGTAAYVYKKCKNIREKEYAFKVRKFEMQIEQEKARLVDGIIKDLKTWLGKAEQYSNELILSFGVK